MTRKSSSIKERTLERISNRFGYGKDPSDIEVTESANLESVNDPLLIERENAKQVQGEYTDCPCEGCNSKIQEHKYSFEMGKEEYIQQVKGVNMGAKVDETRGEKIYKNEEMEYTVAACKNPDCKRHIRPGDLREVAKRKSQGERPYESKSEDYSQNMKEVKDENEKIKETQTNTRNQSL